MWLAPKHTLPQFFTVHAHDIGRGDVLRDIRDGSMSGFMVCVCKTARMTYFGLINYERVGRKYSLRKRQPMPPTTRAK